MPIPRLKKVDDNYQETDYSELLKSLSINLDKYMEKPPICIEIIQYGKKYRFGTLGNFSVIGGQNKSRKTFFMSALVGASLGSRLILNMRGYFEGKDVIFFDTEQSEYDLHMSARRAVLLNGHKGGLSNYKIFCLRPLTPEGRTMFIESYLEKNKNIGLIVIDGVRDLITDVNNPDQSTEIVTKIMQWTKVYNIHASLVLHENPGSDKLRGHLGTEIQNKAETIIRIEKPKDEPEISRVIPKAIRGAKEFEPYAFRINDDVLPELTILENAF